MASRNMVVMEVPNRSGLYKSGILAFSLVELLVVIAIMAVLVSMGAATFSSKKGAEVSQAGGMISDLAKLARQHALSKNTRTALVIAQVNEGGVSRSAISVWDAATTNQLEKWNILPESVAATNSGVSSSLVLPTKFRGTPVASANLYCFYPDGHMTEDFSQSPRVEIKPRFGNAANTFSIVFNPFTGIGRIERL